MAVLSEAAASATVTHEVAVPTEAVNEVESTMEEAVHDAFDEVTMCGTRYPISIKEPAIWPRPHTH